MSLENSSDEIVASDESDLNVSTSNVVSTVARSRRTSETHDHANNFLEADHLQIYLAEGRWIRPYCHDSEGMIDNLSSSVRYQDSYFPEEILEKN